MYGNRTVKILHTLGSTLVILGLSSASAEENSCLSPEIVINPDISKLTNDQDTSALSTDYGEVTIREVRYDFEGGVFKGVPVVRVVERYTLDFSDVKAGIGSEAVQEAKANESCNLILRPRDFDLSPTLQGNVSGGLLIDATFRACQIFHVWCHKGGTEFGTCEVTWKEDVGSHTFGVDIRMTRLFYSESDQARAREAAAERLADDAIERLDPKDA